MSMEGLYSAKSHGWRCGYVHESHKGSMDAGTAHAHSKQTVIFEYLSMNPGFSIFMWQLCFHHLLTNQNNITLLPFTKF